MFFQKSHYQSKRGAMLKQKILIVYTSDLIEIQIKRSNVLLGRVVRGDDLMRARYRDSDLVQK